MSVRRCLGCDAAYDPSAQYCPQCGKFVGKESAGKAGKSRRRKKPEFDRERSLLERKAIIDRNQKALRRSKMRTIPGVLIIATGIFFYFALEEKGVWAFFALVIGLVASLIILAGRTEWLSRGEYESIYGAKGVDGKHRCIFCGRKGIYRQGEYKTDNTYAYCSNPNCEKALWAE